MTSKGESSRRGQCQKIGKDGRGYENKSQDYTGSMRTMFGREADSPTVAQTSPVDHQYSVCRIAQWESNIKIPKTQKRGDRGGGTVGQGLMP